MLTKDRINKCLETSSLTEDSWKDGGVQRPGLEAGLHLAGGGGGVPAVLLLGPHHRPHDQGPQHNLPGQYR